MTIDQAGMLGVLFVLYGIGVTAHLFRAMSTDPKTLEQERVEEALAITEGLT